jgi:hypothetical protein
MKPIPIALAVGLAGLTLWRWGRLTWLVRAAAALACGALVVYGAGAVHLPGLETMVATIGSTLGPYTYALVAVMAFLETGAFVGLLVPGETVVIVGGVVAGQGHVDVLILLGLTWACALGGDLTGYLLGRRLGRQNLLNHGPLVHFTEPRLARVEEFFARYGLPTILVGRFAGAGAAGGAVPRRCLALPARPVHGSRGRRHGAVEYRVRQAPPRARPRP